MHEHSHVNAPRRGSYAALFGVTTTVLLGFSAFAVDISLVRLADLEIQAVADAAAHSAIAQLRATNDPDYAKEMASKQISLNRVAGQQARTMLLEFGTYDGGTYTPGGVRTNAVHVEVEAEVPLTFGAFFWGRDTVTVQARATAATRVLHTVVVMDITNSWGWRDFEDAREGAVAVFDQVTATAGPIDRVGMVVFTGQFGVEYTPLMLVDDALSANIRDEWATLRTASKAGTPSTTDGSCSLHRGTMQNDFTSPAGGCYPNMPREYRDEFGTDHAVGIEMATRMFGGHPDPSVYRAMIILTDGEPNGTGPHAQRGSAGYSDTRWDFTFVGDRRNRPEVIDASVDWAELSWDQLEANIWSVSYRATADWMHDVAQGDGLHMRATSTDDLVPIFNDIVESLPIALVD